MTRLVHWYWPRCKDDDVWCRIDRNLHAATINITIAVINLIIYAMLTLT